MDPVTKPEAPAASFPAVVTWELTPRCGARCLTGPWASRPAASTAGDLSTLEAIARLDRLEEEGVEHLILSGAEPLLRPDWRLLVGHAVERAGLAVSIATEGSDVTRSVADDLERLQVASVTIPLDSHDPSSHDRMRRHPGLFERATAAIRLLARREIPVVVNFTPTRTTAGDARGVVELALELGASAVSLGDDRAAGPVPVDLALDPVAAARLARLWRELAEEFRGRIRLTRREEQALPRAAGEVLASLDEAPLAEPWPAATAIEPSFAAAGF